MRLHKKESFKNSFDVNIIIFVKHNIKEHNIFKLIKYFIDIKIFSQIITKVNLFKIY